MKKLFSSNHAARDSRPRGRSPLRSTLYKDTPPSNPPQIGRHPLPGNAVLHEGIARAKSTDHTHSAAPIAATTDPAKRATHQRRNHLRKPPSSRRRRPMSLPGSQRPGTPGAWDARDPAQAVPPSPTTQRNKLHRRSDNGALLAQFARLGVDKGSAVPDDTRMRSAAVDDDNYFGNAGESYSRSPSANGKERSLPLRLYGEDVADRNMSPRSPSGPDYSSNGYRYNEKIADRNISSSQVYYGRGQDTLSSVSNSTDSMAENAAVHPQQSPPSRQFSIARKSIASPRSSDGSAFAPRVKPGEASPTSRQDALVSLDSGKTGAGGDPARPSQKGLERKYIVEGAPEPPSLEGIVDLTNTVDVDVTERQAPAVVHETIYPVVHHIREEKIMREIHYHDVYHRILPIIDVQVLPPRHLVLLPDGRGLREASAEELVGRVGNWQIVETVSQGAPTSSSAKSVLAQETEPTMVSSRTYTSPGGWPVTETVWKHPPVWEAGIKVIHHHYVDDESSDVPPPPPKHQQRYLKENAVVATSASFASPNLKPSSRRAVHG